MALKDEIKRERKKFLKDATPKEKVAYFFNYYTLHTVIIVLAVVCLSLYIYHVVATPDIVLNGLFLNTYNSENNSYATDLGRNFLEEQGINTSKYDVSFNTGLTYSANDVNSSSNNYDVSQSIMIQSAAGSLDFLVGPFDAMQEFAYGGIFTDLSEVLSEEELSSYEPYLLYIDRAVFEQIDESFGDFDNTASIVIPDFTKPEDMEDPIPVFIDMSHCEELADVYGYDAETLVFGISANAPNPDTLSDFIEYLMK